MEKHKVGTPVQPSEEPAPPDEFEVSKFAPEVSETAAQERGERIETGKAIARGGKSKGFVPGAMESTPKRKR